MSCCRVTLVARSLVALGLHGESFAGDALVVLVSIIAFVCVETDALLDVLVLASAVGARV